MDKIYDEIVDFVEIMFIILSGGSLVLCLNCIVFGLILILFSFLANGLQAFNLIFEFIKEVWLNYKTPIVVVIVLALLFIVKWKICKWHSNIV